MITTTPLHDITEAQLKELCDSKGLIVGDFETTELKEETDG